MNVSASPVATAPIIAPAPAPAGRLLSLDAYRGLIMLTLLPGVIFRSLEKVPGWNWLYEVMEHSPWEGCNYYDLIQPSFMFMVGVAMPFALARRMAQGEPWVRRFRHVLGRALGLMVIGILLDHMGAQKIQIGFIRVLQQIAIAYLFAFFVVGRSFRTQGLVAAAILVGYNVLWMFNPWNGPGGPWAEGNENLGSVFDFWLLGRHYGEYYVGLNAIPSTATMIFGVMAGQLLHKRLPHRRTGLILLGAGLAGVGLGLAVSPWLPLVKRIWTPSFAVYSSGWTTLILLFFFWSIEVMGWKKWAFPFVVVGMNSIAAYVLCSFNGFFRSSTGAWLAWLQPSIGVWHPVLHRTLFAAAAWGLLHWCYRRKIFFKV